MSEGAAPSIRTKSPLLAPELGIPPAAAETMRLSYTCEFSVLRSDGAPVTYPLSPYPNRDGRTIDMSIGLMLPWKAELARKNPKVALSYCSPVRYDTSSPTIVTIRGHAAVRDADLQANTDRYVRELTDTFPGMFAGAPRAVLRFAVFYLARIWVEVTPLRILSWPNGDLNAQPERWEAPGGRALPTSDPPPSGRATHRPSRFTSPADWRAGMDDAIARLGLPSVTRVDGDGWPLTLPVKAVTRHSEGAVIQSASGPVPSTPGPACLTFHTFQLIKGSPYQENAAFTGTLESHTDGLLFQADRQLVSASLPNRKALAISFYNLWRMRHRMPEEARRRGQPAPTIT
jgi:hypothetical protein